MKYAMPVHPSLLEKDFESSQEVSLIPEILNNLKTISTPQQYIDLDERLGFSKTLSKLWFYINKKTGINLRDREKLYPVFKQLSRIFGTKEYNVLYRGVRLPQGPDENLLTEMTVGTGDPELRVLTILENLAYGLRSWTSKKKVAIQGWGIRPGDTRDVVIFKVFNPNIVLDTDQFTQALEIDFGIFDLHEVITYLKDPEVVDLEILSPRVYEVTVVDKG